MKNNISLLFIILLFSFGCTYQEKNKDNNKDTSPSDLRTNHYLKVIKNDSLVLFGKNISDVKKIINIDTISGIQSSDLLLIYYFSGYDCSNCIQLGLNLVDSLELHNKDFKIFVIVTDESTGSVRKKYNYNGYLYNDHDFIMNKYLNYTVTPVLIKVDFDFNVISTYHPDSNYDLNRLLFNKFIYN